MRQSTIPSGVLTHSAIPRYTRPVQAFDDLFGVPAAGVLVSMDAAGDDVPGQAAAHALALDGVGVRRRDLVVALEDPFGGPEIVNAVCTIRIAATVPATRRGIHLSRIGQSVAETVPGPYRDLIHYARTVAQTVARCQYGGATVTVHGRIPYLEQVQADGSGRPKVSLEHLEALARHTIRPGGGIDDLGLRVMHLVACPCVQATYRHATGLRTGSPDRAVPDAGIPAITHSQRCITSIVVHGVREPRPVADMLAALDAVLFRTCNALPRDAELALVYRAHRTPQFIEDAIRAAAVRVAELWPSRASFGRIAGRSRSLESIHGHDITASLTLAGRDRHSPAQVDLVEN